MTTTINKQSTRVDYSQMKEDGVNDTTPRNDLFGTGGKLYFLYVSHTGSGTSAFDYLKLYDTKAQVTLGDDPDFIFMIEKGSKTVFHFPDGLTFANGVAFNGSNGPGSPAGSAPDAMNIQMVFK
tara:strand:+ start:315 stop:686 length:372 start_codon:yes stop_codon:yes gene_type:complete